MSKENKNDIGIDVSSPSESCDDSNCPFHGNLKVRGKVFDGEVVSDAPSKTAVVAWDRIEKVPKYERYERRGSKISAHNPPCLNASEGDKVKIAECRPISKTKRFTIVSIGDEK